jgi:hypothetical protein
VFVPNKGVNAQPLKFGTFSGIPTHMNLTAKPIHKQIYDSERPLTLRKKRQFNSKQYGHVVTTRM